MSQNFDLGPSYFFMLCRHACLEMNVLKVFIKCYMNTMNSKLKICVQKIKVQKVNFYFISAFKQLNHMMTVLLISLDSPNIQL